MRIRFQADADLNQAIVTGVVRREPMIDFQTANISNLTGLSDIDVLSLAAQANRVLVSHDHKTMPKYFSEFIVSQNSAGVIIVLKSFSIREAIENLVRVWQTSEADNWINRIVYLPV